MIVVFGGLDEVEADLLREDRDIGLTTEHLGVGHPLVRVLENELQADFHELSVLS